MMQHILTICVVIAIVFIVTSTLTTEQCDLNEDICFSLADKNNWTFNYVHSKQEYIELISQGKSGLSNPYREKPGLAKRDGIKVNIFVLCLFRIDEMFSLLTR